LRVYDATDPVSLILVTNPRTVIPLAFLATVLTQGGFELHTAANVSAVIENATVILCPAIKSRRPGDPTTLYLWIFL
jgi:hypothetical protein